MKNIAAYAYSTWARTLKRLQTWALCGAVALAGLLGAGQALAASSPPFVDNGDGTVTDTSTGLMWDQCYAGRSGNGSCTTSTGEKTIFYRDEALELAVTQNAANYKAYSDWRVPSIVELQTLVKGTIAPTIDTAAFPASTPEMVCSASINVHALFERWCVYFTVGLVGPSTIFTKVRLVRGGHSSGTFGLLFGGVSGTTTTTTTLSATSPVGTTGYWLVVPHGATPPMPAQVVAGASYGGVTVAAAGNGAMTGKAQKSFAVSGLSAGTAYAIYLLALETLTESTSQLVGPIYLSTPAISTSSIVIDPATPSTLYAGLDGAGVYASTDSSASWSAINTGLANLNVRALAMPNSSTLFAATYDGGVFKGSLSAGNWTWAACGSGLPGSTRLRSLIVDSTGNLYAGGETGVYKNTSACGAWTAQNTGMP